MLPWLLTKQNITNIYFPYSIEKNQWVQHSIKINDDISNQNNNYYFANSTKLLNLLQLLLINSKYNIPNDICKLINDFTFEKKIDYIFGGYNNGETLLTTMECHYDNCDLTCNNYNNCVIFKQNKKCNLKDINIYMSRGLKSFLIKNDPIYDDCIFIINFAPNCGDIGYNLYSFKEEKWLFKKNQNQIFHDLKLPYAQMLLFNNNLLIVSLAKHLYFYNLNDLKKPFLIKKYKIKTEDKLYLCHQMMCIEKTIDKIEIILFGGNSFLFIDKSFLQITVCLGDNFDINNINQIIILEDIINIDVPYMKTTYLVRSLTNGDSIVNDKGERNIMFMTDDCYYLCKYNCCTNKLQFFTNVCVCLVVYFY